MRPEKAQAEQLQKFFEGVYQTTFSNENGSHCLHCCQLNL